MRENVDSNDRNFTISEAAELTGLSADTLRYYEKIGLIASPERGAGRQRMYSKQDIGKIKFLTYLKQTHMPLKKIRDYVLSYEEQDEEQCYALLDEHRQAIESQLANLTTTLEQIHYKLNYFQEIKDGKPKEN